jgi:hypothetical protein
VIKIKEWIKMKKILFSVLSSVLILGVGTVVLATGNDVDKELVNFEKMKPMMEKMHPDSSNEELKEMYDSCHGDSGMMKNPPMEQMENMDPDNMMNSF